MSEDNQTRIVCAVMIAFGLSINGCAQKANINEYSLIDEKEISDGLIEAACYLDGRKWKYQKCE